MNTTSSSKAPAFAPRNISYVNRRLQTQLVGNTNAAIAVFGRVGAVYVESSSIDTTVNSGTGARDFPISADAVLRHRRMSRPRFFKSVGPWLSYL